MEHVRHWGAILPIVSQSQFAKCGMPIHRRATWHVPGIRLTRHREGHIRHDIARRILCVKCIESSPLILLCCREASCGVLSDVPHDFLTMPSVLFGQPLRIGSLGILPRLDTVWSARCWKGFQHSQPLAHRNQLPMRIRAARQHIWFSRVRLAWEQVLLECHTHI